jgi:outer membrane protein assembly factor BamB
MASGCGGGGRADTAPTPGGAATPRSVPNATASATAEEVEARYVIGPVAARRLGYRVDWQYPAAGRDIRRVEISGDSIFTLDRQNFLTRIRRDDGERVWRLPVADPTDEILGITYMPESGHVFLTTGGAMLVLDAGTGSQVQKQRLEKVANTAPIVFGQFLVYGSRNGQLVWHSYDIAYQWRGYQVSRSIQLTPVAQGRYIVVVGNDGRVMVFDGRSASQLWSRQPLDAIVAGPIIGDGAVYAAGLDQYVWAFDLTSGRRLWRYLTESPLTESPVLIDERLYQQIPSEGLVSFEARPFNAPGGQVVWASPDVRGSVLTRRRSRLLCWDAEARRMQMAEEATGAAVESVDLPQVLHLRASSAAGGDLFAAGDDGRIIRLVPRN